jgi:hypothetical protein
MFESSTPDAAKAAATFFTRREALLSALKGTVAAAVAVPVMVQSAPEAPAQAKATFDPENDYPFFGYEPESVKVASASAESLAPLCG